MQWSNEDFAAVFSFLGTMQELLATNPASAAEFAEILTGDCRQATEALRRIVDAINA